jgi:hypothetical protein
VTANAQFGYQRPTLPVPATYVDVRLAEEYSEVVVVLVEAPNQAAVSFAMMLVSDGRNSPGGLCGDQIDLDNRIQHKIKQSVWS